MTRALKKRVDCTILYATETGNSEKYARTLGQMFRNAFNSKVTIPKIEIKKLKFETS
jgi:nitric-oxide synthase, brain